MMEKLELNDPLFDDEESFEHLRFSQKFTRRVFRHHRRR